MESRTLLSLWSACPNRGRDDPSDLDEGEGFRGQFHPGQAQYPTAHESATRMTMDIDGRVRCPLRGNLHDSINNDPAERVPRTPNPLLPQFPRDHFVAGVSGGRANHRNPGAIGELSLMAVGGGASTIQIVQRTRGWDTEFGVEMRCRCRIFFVLHVSSVECRVSRESKSVSLCSFPTRE